MVDCRMTIMGNLTRDPQLRVGSKSGAPFAVLAVAVNNRRFDKPSNQWVTTGTTFFDVLCWNSAGANALSSFKKGDPVIVHGRFRLHEWASEKGSGANATIDADAVGPDVSFGTATFTRGSVGYGLDRVEEYDPSEELPDERAAVPPDADDAGDLSAYADENGEVSEEAADALLARQPAA